MIFCIPTDESGGFTAQLINTTKYNRYDFPDLLYGTFWVEKTEEGFHGSFILDGQSEEDALREGQFVYMMGIYNTEDPFARPPQSTAEADAILKSLEPLNCCFARFERHLEDCIVLGKTYIAEY